MEYKLYSLAVLLFITLSGVHSQGRRQPQCERGSCYPATGDLLIGRAQNLSATSTCGLEKPERYCVVSYLEKDTKCFTCDSRRPWRQNFTEESHRIDNIVSSFKESKTRWWQAENGKEQVSIQLDLEAEFHFTHLIMTFKTFRPKAMLIERSFDFGRSWKVYRYFAQNCRRSFPHVRKRRVNSLTDVICQQKYSQETPSTDGEVIFRVLPPFIPIADPYSEDVQDLLKLTNLRINFTELHTLGDTMLDSRPEIKEKYYYSLYDLTVRGSCSCYGHASQCLPVPGYDGQGDEISRNMVHGQCDCTHNTMGRNCEKCQEGYNDLPWRPARSDQRNECKKCNCNDHSDKCHFDPARYGASGQVSGGVCDDCQDNTMGVNCQECKPFYYQDPNRDIRDKEICQPCDCDPLGSRQNGLCEQMTDEFAGTVAGRCLCKQFVRGDRCDKCFENYWNLQKDNPLGCEPCTCNPDGTVPDLGCDEETGLCRCKRYVTGNNCDACYPGFYGLSAVDVYGCKPCRCDIGGALRYTCDQSTGQCECRPHIRGKHCNEVDPGFFFARLDYYIYEAENGKGSGNAVVSIRNSRDPSRKYWTGTGFMKVMEGDSIEFTVSGLPFSTYYDIVMRYDARFPDAFEDIRVTVIRPDRVDPEGLCGDFNPRDDIKTASLQSNVRYEVVTPPSCLEEGYTYTVRIDFNNYKTGKQTPGISLLIDSILLVPSADYIPIYQGPGLPEYMKNEYLYGRCDVVQFPTLMPELVEQCRKHTFSISAVLHNGALDCDCDRTGSLSLECNPNGGQCECKPNVVGRRCDRCEVGTYGFGPNGCTVCNCDGSGSRDEFCNEKTGQCTCMDNVGGRACDQCRVGYWGFPQCRQCQCNGNAETCDPQTGVCINCTDNTGGDYCERCEDGYYGDPRIGYRVPCKPCMCPGGPGASNQHADTCRYDPRTQEVYCNCRTGYAGRNCDVCADNYYGNPAAPGGTCTECVCNNNTDKRDPGSCDGTTGECLKCLYNTEGFACEHCKPGFYGDATIQNCLECICNNLGTDVSQGDCNRVTGQCNCFPNVVGLRCDQCAPNHWNFSSGEGCSSCGCDPTGSVSLQCNQLDGRCTCISGRGGDKCADCEDYYYGDPNEQCIPCDCNPEGSAMRQCDRRTGQCVCLDGVTGYKCDRCARGTTGDLPNCVPCGECFDNWDAIIQGLKRETHELVKRANDVSVTGAIKAFDEEFRLMQNNIDEVKKILASVDFTQGDIQDIQNMLDQVKANLTANTRELNQVDEDLRNTNARVSAGSVRIELLKARVESLKNLAKELQMNATNIQIQEVGGALNKIREAERDSLSAQDKVDRTSRVLDESKNVRMRTEMLIEDRDDQFNDQLEQNRKDITMLEDDVNGLDSDLTDINNMVCGEPGAPCSDLCGGGGCGKCGGEGCNGAVTMAGKALQLAMQAEEQLNRKTTNATEYLIPKIQEAKGDAMEAKRDAQMAFDAANKAKMETEDTKEQLEMLLDKIRGFLSSTDAPTADEVRKVAEEVLAMRIPLTSERIQDLTDKINKAVSSLTNIDNILIETADSRAVAEKLKKEAENASSEAQDIRNTAQNVRDALDEAQKVQKRAEMAIQQAEQDIRDTEEVLNSISSDTEDISTLTTNSRDVLEPLKKRLEQLRKNYTALMADTLATAEKAANEATDFANDAYNQARDLDSRYNSTYGELNDKYNKTTRAKKKAEELNADVSKLYSFTEKKLNELKDIQDKINGNDERLTKLSDEIDRLNKLMDEYLDVIREKARYYETC